MHKYCWWKKSCTTWIHSQPQLVNAGFLNEPSTVPEPYHQSQAESILGEAVGDLVSQIQLAHLWRKSSTIHNAGRGSGALWWGSCYVGLFWGSEWERCWGYFGRNKSLACDWFRIKLRIDSTIRIIHFLAHFPRSPPGWGMSFLIASPFTGKLPRHEGNDWILGVTT